MRSLGKNRFDRKGREQGLWEFYYDNGNIEMRGSFKDGKAEDIWEFYYDNGNIESKGLYVNGDFIKWL
jgi:antitoxin component YwqK of YwqJK toxin-antitoxin module